VGKRNDFGFLSRALFLVFFEFLLLKALELSLKRLGPKTKGKGKRRRVFLLSFVVEKYLRKYLDDETCTKAKKKKKSILSFEKKYSLFEREAGLPLSSHRRRRHRCAKKSSRLEIQSARKKVQNSTSTGKKSRHLVERGSVVGRFIDREKFVFARVFPL
jgi:site-specific recombinase XerD